MSIENSDSVIQSPSSTKKAAQLQAGQEWAPRQWVARCLGVSRSTVIRLERSEDKQFPKPTKFGKIPLFNVEEVRQWALSHRG